MYVTSGFGALIVFDRKVDVFYLQQFWVLLIIFSWNGWEQKSVKNPRPVSQVQLNTVLMSHQLRIKLLNRQKFPILISTELVLLRGGT